MLGSETFLAETYLRRPSPLCEGICRARLTKRSAPGVWPGATVGGVSLKGNPESLVSARMRVLRNKRREVMVGIEPVMPTDALLRLWILKPPAECECAAKE